MRSTDLLSHHLQENLKDFITNTYHTLHHSCMCLRQSVITCLMDKVLTLNNAKKEYYIKNVIK